MPRRIIVFDANTEELVAEYEIENDLIFLRKLFGVLDDDPLMYYGYQVEYKHKEAMLHRFNIDLDLDKNLVYIEYSE